MISSPLSLTSFSSSCKVHSLFLIYQQNHLLELIILLTYTVWCLDIFSATEYLQVGIIAQIISKRCFTVTIIFPFAMRFSYVFSKVQFFSVTFQDMFCAFHDFILKTVWNRMTWVITQKHLQQIDPNNTKMESDIIAEICVQINLSIEWIFQDIHVKMMKKYKGKLLHRS